MTTPTSTILSQAQKREHRIVENARAKEEKEKKKL